MEHTHHTAVRATLHCLVGCSIGEIGGLVAGTALGWSNLATVVLSIVLAFVCGYLLSLITLLRSGLGLAAAFGIALAADTLSIATMELVDTLTIVAIPGAMNAGLSSPLFWVSLAAALFLAFWAALPVNRYLIARGKGHALAHQQHEHH